MNDRNLAPRAGPGVRAPHSLSRLLVASALDPASDDVVSAAAAWARAGGAELVLVHATPEVVATDPLGPWLVATGGLAPAELEAQLADQARRCAQGVARTRTEVALGAPHRVIAEACRRHRADLLVAGSHGRGGGLPGLGSTTDRLVRRADTPVLVVRRANHRPPRRVLATTDLSDLAGDSLHLGLRLLSGLAPTTPAVELEVAFALGFFESLELRRAHGLGAPGDAAAQAEIERQVKRLAEQALEAFLDRALGDLPPQAVENLRPRVLPGDPRLELLAAARQGDVDLLIAGTHGRGGFDRFLVGSVASRLLAEAPCDVLVVPPRAALAEGISTAVHEQTDPR